MLNRGGRMVMLELADQEIIQQQVYSDKNILPSSEMYWMSKEDTHLELIHIWIYTHLELFKYFQTHHYGDFASRSIRSILSIILGFKINLAEAN
jgi:hypothetical protein